MAVTVPLPLLWEELVLETVAEAELEELEELEPLDLPPEMAKGKEYWKIVGSESKLMRIP